MTIYIESIEPLKKTINDSVRASLLGKRCSASKKQLLNAINGTISLKNFPHIGKDIYLNRFNWQSSGEDRNWWWQIQALPFLNWYMGAYAILSSDEKILSQQFICDSIKSWLYNANEHSPLLWHDHASAFRLRNITNWLSFCLLNDDYEFILNAGLDKPLTKTINNHIAFLLDEKNYSKHTNHGFDQMFCLHTLCLSWPLFEQADFVLNVSCNRLVDELDFAFTNEGVHKENSPGYQRYMLGKLNDLILLKKYGDTKLSFYAEEKYKKASEFFDAIILPNGKLPMIGDTDGDVFIKKIELKNGINVHDYSKSGYVIISGIDHLDKPYHLIIKNSHFSAYHRHDDDLSIHFFYDNKIILGDGGLGFYQEKDKKRILLRSADSHSTILIPGLFPIRDNSLLVNKPSLSVNGHIVTALSFSYGFMTKRTIDFSSILDGNLHVKDEVVERSEFNTNFFIPAQHPIKKDDNSFYIDFKDFHVNISLVNTTANSYFMSGAEDNAICSYNYGVFEDATRFGWAHLNSGEIEWKLSVHSEKNLTQAVNNVIEPANVNARRTIRLKEWPPLSKIVKIPSNEYIERVERLPIDSYEINTDENGFILTSGLNGLKNKKPLWLFFGDSFVESIFVHNGKRFTDVLAGIFEHVKILNGGYSGTTSLQIINSIINKAIPLSPDKIFVFIPSNDSRCIKLEGGYWNNTKLLSPIIGTLDGNEHEFDFGDDLTQLELALNLIKDITVRIGCTLYLGTTPHRHLNYLNDPYLQSRYPNQSYFNKISAERLNVGNHVRQWCSREKISLIDLEKEMDCFMEFSYDEVHLNEHGSTFAARAIERHLNNNSEVVTLQP